ncbi:putative FeS assembly ATPase SufC [Micrococcus luteus SK58]|nr:putative FeS assembly ATPase SufC [Micrococcus luteus SK58]
MATLQITDLHVQIATENGPKEILKGLSLTIETGETHAIMGPNGSGKSTLASTIAGHPRYEVTSGSITLDGEDVLEMSVDERAQAGLFLAMQYPVEIPGVTMTNFLRTAKTALDGQAPSLRTWTKDVKGAFEALQIDPAFMNRQRQRGLLRRREEARRDPPARAVQAQVRDPRRDRLRPRRRRAAHRLRGRQPRPGAERDGHPADHPLHADPQLHQAGPRARAGGRPRRRVRRPGARRAARGRGLRPLREGRGGGLR